MDLVEQIDISGLSAPWQCFIAGMAAGICLAAAGHLIGWIFTIPALAFRSR